MPGRSLDLDAEHLVPAVAQLLGGCADHRVARVRGLLAKGQFIARPVHCI